MCIAVRRILEAAESREFLAVPAECVFEALKIPMTSNNREVFERHSTQINGASITDIFGAVFIDPIAREGSLLIPVDWKRYEMIHGTLKKM